MFVHETLRVVYRNRVVVDTVCAGCQAALDAVWEYLDVDQSGTIEADEFVAWWPPQVPRVRLRSPSCHVVCWASPDDTCPRRMPPCPSS